jgi:hypothetical protein
MSGTPGGRAVASMPSGRRTGTVGERVGARLGPPTSRRRHARSASRCRRSPAVARHAAWLPRGPLAARQGPALSGRPAHRRRDRRRHAPRRCMRRGCARLSSCCGARAYASTKPSRSARRSSISGAARCSCVTARAVAVVRSAWTTGLWEQLRPWLTARVDLPVGPLLCIATGPTRGRAWSAAPHARSFATLPPERACAGGSRLVSFATRTPSRWPARASR